MEQVGYQIVHSIAGRIRIRVPWLETDLQSASIYQRLVEKLSGVKTVRINPLAQSIVVEYSAEAVSISRMEELLISTMQQVKLTSAAPTVEQEPNPESSTVAESFDIDVSEPPFETFISSQSTTNNVEQDSSPHLQSKQAFIPEIPSPWDEEVTEQAST